MDAFDAAEAEMLAAAAAAGLHTEANEANVGEV